MALNPGAKFKVGKFDGAGNFGLWQRRVKDVLAQQGLSKALRENKLDDSYLLPYFTIAKVSLVPRQN
ncbi:hypothetical protein Lal_00018713 [Lupinus albus]|nr:hypothetical protein Lal_00018713 [Lupinus albus]